MGLPAQTAKSLARIILEETKSEEIASSILSKWDDVRGINGNFRVAISDILVFVKKLGNKSSSNNQKE